MILELALSYTPPGSDLSVTLAIVQDATLLTAAVKIAIAEAEASAIRASNPVHAKGFTTKAAYLRRCLERLLYGEVSEALPSGPRKVLM